MEDLQEEAVDENAGRKGLHVEKENISEELQFKKDDKVRAYPCKEPGCGKKFGTSKYLQTTHQNCALK